MERYLRAGRVLALAAAVLLLLFGRIPSFTNDFCDPDLAGISYGARDLLGGGTIYENCVETKPPGAYLIFAACFAAFGRTLVPIYVLAALLHVLALLALARMAQRAAGPVAGIFTAFFYACLAIDSAAAANCPNYETWMSFFAVFGLFALSPERPWLSTRRLLAAGAWLGVAFLMKQQAAAFIAMAAVWLWWSPTGERGAGARPVGWLGLGVALPLAIVVIAWMINGGLPTLLADLDPRRLGNYVGATQWDQLVAMGNERMADHLRGAWPMWSAVAGGLVLRLWAGERRRRFGPHLLYLLTAVVAFAAGSRFFFHYLIILAAPLALAAGHAVGSLDGKLGRLPWRIALCGALAVALTWTVRIELDQSWRMLRLVSAGQDPINEEMLFRFTRDDANLENRSDDATYRQMGAYVAAHSAVGEGLYVWPYIPQVYFWADRRAPTKHYMYFEVAAALPYKRGGWHATVDAQVVRTRAELLRDLEAQPPRFVVLPMDDRTWDHAFPELEQWVTKRYVREPQAPGEPLRVYRLP